MTKFLTPEDVIRLNADTISRQGGGAFGVRDFGLLESAVMMPQQKVFGQVLHETIEQQTGAYIFHICLNHAFENGNKRTALLAGETFLAINDKELSISQEEKIKLLLDIENKKVSKEELTKYLESKIKDIDTKREQELKEKKEIVEKEQRENKEQEKEIEVTKLEEQKKNQSQKEKQESEKQNSKEEKPPNQESNKDFESVFTSKELNIDRTSDNQFVITLASGRIIETDSYGEKEDKIFLEEFKDTSYRQMFVEGCKEAKVGEEIVIMKVKKDEEPPQQPPPTPTPEIKI